MNQPLREQHPSGLPEPLRNLLLAVGMVLVLAGAVLLLTFAAFAIQAVTDPEGFTLFEFMLGFLGSGDGAVYGSIDGRVFEFGVGESVRIPVYLFLGLAVLGIASGIVRALFRGGVELLALAGAGLPRLRERSRRPPPTGWSGSADAEGR